MSCIYSAERLMEWYCSECAGTNSG